MMKKFERFIFNNDVVAFGAGLGGFTVLFDVDVSWCQWLVDVASEYSNSVVGLSPKISFVKTKTTKIMRIFRNDIVLDQNQTLCSNKFFLFNWNQLFRCWSSMINLWYLFCQQKKKSIINILSINFHFWYGKKNDTDSLLICHKSLLFVLSKTNVEKFPSFFLLKIDKIHR